MIRFNYLGPDRTLQAAQLGGLMREPSMRAPLAAFAFVLVALGCARGFEDWRRDSALARWASLRAQAAVTATADRRVLARANDLGRLESIAGAVRGIRRSGTERAIELAAIGNVLPLHVWLTGIHGTSTGWSISGGARSVADVGNALLALERMSGVASATLVSTQSGDRDDRTVQYELRLGRRSR